MDDWMQPPPDSGARLEISIAEASEFRKLLDWMYGRDPVVWSDLHKRLGEFLATEGR